eukprot:6172774-Pleurochrysis_carterae.AAC.1
MLGHRWPRLRAQEERPRLRCLARCSGPAVHRRGRDKEEDAHQLYGLGDADIIEERCRLALQLLERLRLRLRSLALEH